MRHGTRGSGARSAGALTAGLVFVSAGLVLPTASAQEAGVVLRADWGAEPGRLGRRDADESAPEGPMSFAVTPDGEVWVLDQVNRRLARFGADGVFRRTVAIDSDTFQGLALGPGGELVLLDRLAARTVVVLDPDGTVLGRVALEGAGVAEGGGTTGVFAGADGVWVEYEHRDSWRVLDGQWADPLYRWRLAGRPLGSSGVAAQAWRDGPASVALRTIDRVSGATLAETTLGFDEPVRRIVELAGGPQGDVVLAVHLATEDPASGYEIVHETLVVLVLDAGLLERRRFSTAPSVGPWEQFKELEVGADGTIRQMVFGEEGVEVRRWLP